MIYFCYVFFVNALCLCLYILTIVIHNICCTIFIKYQTISFQPKLAYTICVFTFRCCDVRYNFCLKQCSIRLFFQLFFYEGSCLIYVICVCLRLVVSTKYCVLFLLWFPSSCVPYVANFFRLSIFR